MADTFPVGGYLRRARRLADLSQRQLAAKAEVSASAIAKLEGTTRTRPTIAMMQKLLAAAGLRLAVVDADGAEVEPMPEPAQRDYGRRNYPAHLDVRRHRRLGDWWYDQWQTTTLPPPTHTFHLDRWLRDRRRDQLDITARDDDDRHQLAGDGYPTRRVTDIIYAYLRRPGRSAWP